MFVSTTVTIPRYLLISKLHIVNTYFAHILPLISMPVGVFLIKQFLDQVPDSLIEAAKVDGASSFYIYRKIVLPLIRPAIATVAILSFQIVWNNIETSSLYVNDETLRTFAFYMSTLTSNIGNNVAGQGMAAAATLIMFLPNLIMFIVLQSNVMNRWLILESNRRRYVMDKKQTVDNVSYTMAENRKPIILVLLILLAISSIAVADAPYSA